MIKKLLFPFVVLLMAAGFNLHAQQVDHWETIIKADDTWSYFVGNSEPPATWAETTFDASAWPAGKGGFGYGDNDDGTTISQSPSVYFRKSFTIADKSKIASLMLYIDFDDGFVAYLNGREITRTNMSGDARPPYNQYALSTEFEAKLPTGGIPARYQLSADMLSQYLIQGENVLAVQVHNANATSSDLSSTTFLIAGISVPGSYYQANPAWFTPPTAVKHNLPLVIIETDGKAIVNDPKVLVKVKVVDNGSGKFNTVLDTQSQYDGYAGIEIRGQSSQMFPKKSYDMELRDQQGAEVKASLMGLPEESDWILSAQYSDKTLLRNPMTFYLGGRMNPWQPHVRFCEVYLNGEYIGVYHLIEKIKRDKNRVDIAKLNPDEVSGDDVTGGYIFKVDKLDGDGSGYFTTNPSYQYFNAKNYTYTYVYPKADVIVNQQKNYLYGAIVNFENALNGPNFKDSDKGYRKYIDVKSFIDILIVNELGNNVDGLRFSTFFYKQKDSDGGKIVAGPYWDFDLCYGNLDFSPRHLATNEFVHTNYGNAWESCIHWWVRLMEDPDFKAEVKKRWKALRSGPLHKDSIFNYLDTQSAFMGEAVTRNFAKWPIMGQYVWPNAFVGQNYTAEMNYLKDWISRRLFWLDYQWLVKIDEPELPEDDPVKIFPVPFDEQFTLALNLKLTENVYVEIYNMLGRKVWMTQYSERVEGYQEITVTPPLAAPGIYIIRVWQPSGIRKVIKVIKQ